MSRLKLSFEKSREGRHCTIMPPLDVPSVALSIKRTQPLRLPALSEIEISRHFSQLAERTHGMNDGFYPLGSCTMKYNPKINDKMAAMSGFADIHPLQPLHTVQGCLAVLTTAEKLLCDITGMDNMTFQPAAGAHGELTGVLLIKAHHLATGQTQRTQLLVPDSAHGTNPATAAMAGFTVVNIPSNAEGCVDLAQLRAAVSDKTAGLMLTNPNTLGIFDKQILEITKIVHEAGGLNYYDGANLNAIMGVVRPGDMGFDVVHLNLHKTFATPHGGGGPGSGAVGCKSILCAYLPQFLQTTQADGSIDMVTPAQSIGSVKAFYGNFAVVVKTLTYLLTLGREGITDAAHMAVLQANYLKTRLSGSFVMAQEGFCMHEFVMTLANLKKEYGVSAMDMAKAMLDYGIHPPTMYFPLIVDEALMVEPTETEPIEVLDEFVALMESLLTIAKENPEALHEAPTKTVIRRVDELNAARNPVLRYSF